MDKQGKKCSNKDCAVKIEDQIFGKDTSRVDGKTYWCKICILKRQKEAQKLGKHNVNRSLNKLHSKAYRIRNKKRYAKQLEAQEVGRV